MGEAECPEEIINHYVILQRATGNIISALGVLALLWSTVVLLGGFVSVVGVKEFWVLTGLSFLMACRVVENYDNEFQRGIYMEEEQVINFFWRQRKWINDVGWVWFQQIVLGMVLLFKFILLQCLETLTFGVVPSVSLGVSVWRLVQRDYGDAGGDTANRTKLTAALDIFYAIIVVQSISVMYWETLGGMLRFQVFAVAVQTKKQCGDEKWIPKAVDMYCTETIKRFKKDGELPKNWNLIRYGVELLQSGSADDDHLWGARLLDKLLRKDNIYVRHVRHKLLFSRSSIQNLISIIGQRATTDDNIETRDRATRIIAHIASDLHLAHFPGTLQCICSLLEGCNQFYEPQVSCPSSEKNPDKQSRSLDTSNHQNDYNLVVTIQDQTDHEVVNSLSAQRKRTTLRERLKEALETPQLKLWQALWESRKFAYKSRGAKELISQGLLILERLTQDKENCTEISKHHRLLSKLTSPLRSHDFLNNTAMVEMLSKSLTVVSRLLTCPGDGASRLLQELASNTEAVSNLMAILENDSEGGQQLHQQQALEILTELAFDDSFKSLDFNKFLKALLRIFLEEEASNTIVEPEKADREKATRLIRGKAGEALARLLSICSSRDFNVANKLSRQEAIDLLTKVLDQILSSKMGTNADGAENVVESQPPEEADSVQSHIQEDELQSEERKFVVAMLALATVIYNNNVISKDDFAHATPQDAALAQKLKEILVEVNKHCTVEYLRIVKLTCQLVIAMIQVKPRYIEHFNEHNLKEVLTEALKTMSEFSDCMLFAGNDRELIKPVRSLSSLVKEAHELLNTAQEQGN